MCWISKSAVCLVKEDVAQGSSVSCLPTEMQKRRLIVLLFCVLSSSCVYCQLGNNYVEEEIDAKQVATPTRGFFGKHRRHQIVDARSKLSETNNETIAVSAKAEETSKDVEKNASREGKFTVIIILNKNDLEYIYKR